MPVISTVNAIPLMTSATSPSGVVKASTEYSTYNAWKAFDKVNIDSSSWLISSNIPAWISYEFNEPKQIVKYSLIPYSEVSSPKNWTFEGSNDGTNWDILDTQNEYIIDSWSPRGKKLEFEFSNDKKYKTYRVNISSANSNVGIRELEMFELIYNNKILLLSNDNTNKFIESSPTMKLSDSDKYSLLNITNDGRTVTSTNTRYTGVRGISPITDGKYYIEVKIHTNVRLDASHLGVIEKDRALDYGTSLSSFTGARTYRGNGTKYTPSSSSYGTAWVIGDIISILIDMDSGKLSFWKNGVDLGLASSDLKSMSNVYLLAMPYGTDDTFEFIFDKESLVYNMPNGYKPFNESCVIQIPSSSEQNFINYGMDSPVQVDGISNGKNYILQDTVSEDVDGLWKTQLDRKPLSISFN